MATGPGEGPTAAAFPHSLAGDPASAYVNWQKQRNKKRNKKSLSCNYWKKGYDRISCACLLREGGWHFLRSPWCTRRHQKPHSVHRRRAEEAARQPRQHRSPIPLQQPAEAPAFALFLIVPTPRRRETEIFSWLWTHFSLRSDCRFHTSI